MIDALQSILTARRNIQKIYIDDTITVPIAFSSSITEYTLVTHNLGYIPTVRVFYEPVSGELWPMSPNQYSSTDGGTGNTLGIYGNPVVTETDLKVRVVRPGVAVDVKFYYRIYLDS